MTGTQIVGGKLTAPGYQLFGGTPERFTEHIRKEAAKWADVVKRAGVKIDCRRRVGKRREERPKSRYTHQGDGS